MYSNTHSAQPPEPSAPLEHLEPPERPGCPGRLGFLPVDVDELAAEDLDQLTDTALNDQIRELQQELARLEGQWLRRLAAADARGAAGGAAG